MTIALRSVGSASNGAASCTPGIPAGTAQNDILICVASGVTAASAPFTWPAGWTAISAASPLSTRRMEVRWKRAGASETSPTITAPTSNVITAQIAAYSGCLSSGNVVDQVAAASTQNAVTATYNALTPTVANTELVLCGGVANQSSGATGYSGSNPTPTEHFDSGTLTGSESSIFLASGLKNDTTTSGSRTSGIRASPSASFAFNLLPETATADLEATPTSLTFNATEGGANPATQTFDVTNVGDAGGTLTYGVSDDAAWLTVSGGDGSAPDTLTVAVDITGLDADLSPFVGTITVNPDQTGDPDETITVTLNLAHADVLLSASPSSLTFNTPEGVNPANQTSTVTDAHAVNGAITVTDDASWLTVTTADGNLPDVLTASVNVTGLLPGVYTATITVDPTSPGSSLAIPVSLTVTAPSVVEPEREPPPYRVPLHVAIRVTHADGRTTRFGADEKDPGRIPMGLTHTTKIPGGFDLCQFTLARKTNRDYDDLNLGDDITVYGAGNRTIWEGRIRALPRSPFGIQVDCVGHASHFKDDPSFREIYVDRDLGSWGEPPFDRRAQLLSASKMINAGAAWSRADGVVAIDFANQPSGDPRTQWELWYRALPGRVTVGELQFIGSAEGTTTGWVHELWAFRGDIHDGDAALLDADFLTDLDSVIHTAANTSASANRFVFIIDSQGTSITPTGPLTRQFSAFAVFGSHGLTRRTTVAGQPDGLRASDVIADIVSRTAPRLTYSTGVDGSIESTAYAIAHLVFDSPISGDEAILQANKFDQYEWGVYDNREFFYRRPNPDRLTWEVRIDQGADVSLEGDTLDTVFNGVFVTYTDPNGRERTAGPPNSQADVEHEALADTSELNPVNAHGYERRWAHFALSQITDDAGAVKFGATFLQQMDLPQRRGSVTLHGTVTHPIEGIVPVWRIRAGDFLRIADHPANVARRIISTSYDDATKTLRADLDNTPALLDALQERVGVSLIGVL